MGSWERGIILETDKEKGRGEEKGGRRACLVSKHLPGGLVKEKKNCRPEAVAQGTVLAQ